MQTINGADIYVDMDGVLADFEGHAENTFKKPFDELKGKQNKKDGFRHTIPQVPDWWQTIPPLDDAATLWNYIKKFDPYILSAYAEWDERSIKDKPIWLKKHFGVTKRILLVKREQKQDYAINKKTKSPNILIDDYDKNCNEWRAAGGIAIHHVGARSTILKLRELGF